MFILWAFLLVLSLYGANVFSIASKAKAILKM